MLNNKIEQTIKFVVTNSKYVLRHCTSKTIIYGVPTITFTRYSILITGWSMEILGISRLFISKQVKTSILAIMNTYVNLY